MSMQSTSGSDTPLSNRVVASRDVDHSRQKVVCDKDEEAGLPNSLTKRHVAE